MDFDELRFVALRSKIKHKHNMAVLLKSNKNVWKLEHKYVLGILD